MILELYCKFSWERHPHPMLYGRVFLIPSTDKHPNDWRVEDVNKLDIHLWAETRKALKEIIQTNQFKEIRPKKNNELALAGAIVELRNHLNRNIFALEKRFKEDFQNDFVEEVKNTFDFDFMVKLQEAVNEDEKTIQEAFDEIEAHGNSDLKFMMMRQSKKILQLRVKEKRLCYNLRQ